MSNTYTKSYVDGSALTEAMLDSAYQTLQPDVSNLALSTTGSTSGQALISNGSNIAPSFQTISDPLGPFALRNYGLKATVATGVMTITLKTKAGATPSGADAVDFVYSSNGTTSGTYTPIQITSATTFPLNASASLGYTATTVNPIFVYGYYNSSATTVKFAVSARADFDSGRSITTTAVSASADTATAIYATAALTVVPRLLGVITAAHNAAGAWQTPTSVNVSNTPHVTSVGTANFIGVSMTSVGANAIGNSMGASGANAVGAAITGSVAANNIAARMTSTGANAIGNSMGASGANNVAAAVTSSVAASSLLAASTFGTALSATTFNTSTWGAGFNAGATVDLVTTGRYLYFATGVVKTTGGASIDLKITRAGSTEGAVHNFTVGAAETPFSLMWSDVGSASETIAIVGQGNTARFKAGGTLMALLLYKT